MESVFPAYLAQVLDLTGCEKLELIPDLRKCPLVAVSIQDCGKLGMLPRFSTKRPIAGRTYGCDQIDASLASNVDTTLNAVLLAAALLATLGYSSLANPTDWDDGLSNPPGDTMAIGADTLQVHGNAPRGWLAAYLIFSQVSFYGSIVSILWCLISVLLNADAKRMLQRGGDRKRLMLGIATSFLGVALVAILAAYFCAGMTSVSPEHKRQQYLVVMPTGVWGGVFVLSLVVFLGFPDSF
ncbi:hypothetical protein JKP88DRAFT_280073 [Tribonema minus]|uniref:Uncharacterized protein n=1 Tax=Tribonema minus TaxID=303371 RepID=A0A835Z0J3_9STRA|nr:hypothetical protein JKP88DRAFT_280073 [Tribonema minus]